MRIVFVYEHFFPPFDEGVKNFAYQAHRHYQNNHEVSLVKYHRHIPNFLNSLLLVPRLLLRLFRNPDKLVYIPQAALTFSSLVKIWALHLFYARKLVVVGVQKRQLRPWQTKLLRNLKMPQTFVLSTAMAESLKNISIDARVVEIGIDREVYRPAKDKAALRNKYGVDSGKKVLLHVGHIKKSRNIEWLLEVKVAAQDLEIIIVGSTATERDRSLSEKLESAGIRVIQEYLPNINEIYQLVDYYCFPVLLDDAAMETPLSVLEAMATNLPVLTTRFGRLPEQFEEDQCFRYVSSTDEILESLLSDFGTPCLNREKTKKYTWQATAELLLAS